MPVDRSSVAAGGQVEALGRRSSGETDLDVARRVIRAEIDGLEDLSEALDARFEDAVAPALRYKDGSSLPGSARAVMSAVRSRPPLLRQALPRSSFTPSKQATAISA